MPDPDHRATVLWLIRHPEVEESAHGVCYGSLDVRLSAAGLQQARLIARSLATEHFHAIYASPRQRCVDAAREIATGRSCAVIPVDDLRELDFGAFEGLRYDEISARYPDMYRQWMEHPAEIQFPGGECFSQMSQRVIGITRSILARHEGGNILFVTHGGTVRIILAEALGTPAPDIFQIAQHYGAINRIRYSEGTAVVELMNSLA